MGTYRNKKLTNLAKGAPCMFELYSICNGDKETSVWAHSNKQKHGKGMQTKADDYHGAIACSACHAEYDNGKKLTREEKDIAFRLAEWRTMRYLLKTGQIEFDLTAVDEDVLRYLWDNELVRVA